MLNSYNCNTRLLMKQRTNTLAFWTPWCAHKRSW